MLREPVLVRNEFAGRITYVRYVLSLISYKSRRAYRDESNPGGVSGRNRAPLLRGRKGKDVRAGDDQAFAGPRAGVSSAT